MHGLTLDGICGPNTFNYLTELSPTIKKTATSLQDFSSTFDLVVDLKNTHLKSIETIVRQSSQQGPNYLKPEYLAQLVSALTELSEKSEINTLSKAEFSLECNRIQLAVLREQLLSMSGDEFYDQYMKGKYYTKVRTILGREKGEIVPPEPRDYLEQYNQIYDQSAQKYGVP